MTGRSSLVGWCVGRSFVFGRVALVVCVVGFAGVAGVLGPVLYALFVPPWFED